ncbi:hypothetical protein F4861DRAFT_549804 [Xylaria intraflava]|nr:hypothetical protein F4861DRAFT_549804 [Xylaria intraflava]
MEQTEASVQTLAEECIAKFKGLMITHNNMSDKLETWLGDFGLWAKNIGVFSDLQPPKQLDFVKDMIVVLEHCLDFFIGGAETDEDSEMGARVIDSFFQNILPLTEAPSRGSDFLSMCKAQSISIVQPIRSIPDALTRTLNKWGINFSKA